MYKVILSPFLGSCGSRDNKLFNTAFALSSMAQILKHPFIRKLRRLDGKFIASNSTLNPNRTEMRNCYYKLRDSNFMTALDSTGESLLSRVEEQDSDMESLLTGNDCISASIEYVFKTKPLRTGEKYRVLHYACIRVNCSSMRDYFTMLDDLHVAKPIAKFSMPYLFMPKTNIYAINSTDPDSIYRHNMSKQQYDLEIAEEQRIRDTLLARYNEWVTAYNNGEHFNLEETENV